DARGVVSPTERQSFIARVRDLAKGSAAAWIDKLEEQKQEALK
ncbi:MAG: glycine--tRNA ligase subunit alpha, partial [Caulobacterales bacterium]|nr:glycine--tRNA ligase subunit alpha [Caulobacterales bacterium]